MITKKEVENIAKLARIDLTEKETRKLQKELSLILDYIKKIKEVKIRKTDASEIELGGSFQIKNIIREDKSEEKKREKREKLLNLAPQTKDGYLKVRQIL